MPVRKSSKKKVEEVKLTDKEDQLDLPETTEEVPEEKEKPVANARTIKLKNGLVVSAAYYEKYKHKLDV